MENFVIRSARADEAMTLTDLAMRSKASWGYSDDFMAACRAELTFTPERMAEWTVWVATVDDAIVGTIALNVTGRSGEAQLEQFFVDPDFHARGIGTALMAELLKACCTHGVKRLGVDSDPNAEGIYTKFGFVTVGRSPSGSILGRTLPRMARLLSSQSLSTDSLNT